MTSLLRRRGILRGAAAIVAASLLLAPAASASADAAREGFWYFDAFHIQDAHDAGFTGEGMTIVVVDSQINLELPTLQGADIDVLPSVCYDENGDLIPPTSTDLSAAEHGSNIVSYLVGNGEGYEGQPGVKGIVPDAHIIYMSRGRDMGDAGSYCGKDPEADHATGGDTIFAAAAHAGIDAGARIITVSATNLITLRDAAAFAEALNAGIIVLASVKNVAGSEVAVGDFPAGANGAVGVQSVQSNGLIQARDTDISLHFDKLTDVVGPGFQIAWQGDESWDQLRLADGTSIATPIVAGFVALVAQKYPHATGNQLIQTLIRNTGTEDHELVYDSNLLYGYGIASATHMLAVDPTQYDDVNPLITADGVPSPAELADPSILVEKVAEDDSYFEGTPSSETARFDLSFLVPITLGALALIVITVIISVVLARRASRRAA